MSTGAVSATQGLGTTALGASGGGALSNQQSPLQQQILPQGPDLGIDRIKAPNEVIVPPLLPSAPPTSSAAADSIVSSQVLSSAAIAGSCGLVALLVIFGIPLTMAATGKHAKAGRALFREQEIEHTIHEMHRSGQDKSLDWVEHTENLTVREHYVRLLVADMKAQWIGLLEESNPKKFKENLEHAHVMGLPVDHLPKIPEKLPSVSEVAAIQQELKSENSKLELKGIKALGGFHPSELSDEHLSVTAKHVHDHIDALDKEQKAADGDLKRYINEQSWLLHVKIAGFNVTRHADHIALNRMKRFRDGLSSIHKEAQTEFYRHVYVKGAVR